jgi:signal transduction histidine kinase
MVLIGSFFSFNAQQQIAFTKQKMIAQKASYVVADFIHEKFNAMEAIAGLTDPEMLPPQERQRILSSLFRENPFFKQLVLWNSNQQKMAEIHRLPVVHPDKFHTPLNHELFNKVRRGERYISSIFFDNQTHEPSIIMAVRVKDGFGRFKGVLAAEVDLKFMRDLVSELKIGKKSRVYVVDRHGYLIALKDIRHVMRSENLKNIAVVKQYMNHPGPANKTGTMVLKGISGTLVVGTYVSLGMPDWALVVEQSANEAYRLAIATVFSTLAFTIFFAVIIGFFSVSIGRRLTKPLENLMNTATRIAGGEMDLQAVVEGPGELAGLAEAFNTMTAQLRKLISSLETQSQHQIATIQQYVNYMAQVGQGNLNIRLPINEPSIGMADPMVTLGYQLNETTANLEMIIEQLQEANNRIKKRESELQVYAGKLQKSNAELEQFAYVASHDLQEPLRKIRMFNDKLQELLSEVLDERARDYLQRMNNAATRMEKLISDLLTYSRITTRAKPYQPVDLNETLREVLADLEISINENQAQVLSFNLPVIDADPLQIRQLFQNLIGNAIKYHRPGVTPVIRIESQTISSIGEPDYYRIDVIDNGIGFDNAYAQRIFGLFQRLHGRDQYDGTGLGLAICRKILLEHGGAITASGKLNEGATFTLRFPVKRGEEANP